jgi:hypothetical protein
MPVPTNQKSGLHAADAFRLGLWSEPPGGSYMVSRKNIICHIDCTMFHLFNATDVPLVSRVLLPSKKKDSPLVYLGVIFFTKPFATTNLSISHLHYDTTSSIVLGFIHRKERLHLMITIELSIEIMRRPGNCSFYSKNGCSLYATFIQLRYEKERIVNLYQLRRASSRSPSS